jgi:hypothetical protein
MDKYTRPLNYLYIGVRDGSILMVLYIAFRSMLRTI